MIAGEFESPQIHNYYHHHPLPAYLSLYLSIYLSVYQSVLSCGSIHATLVFVRCLWLLKVLKVAIYSIFIPAFLLSTELSSFHEVILINTTLPPHRHALSASRAQQHPCKYPFMRVIMPN